MLPLSLVASLLFVQTAPKPDLTHMGRVDQYLQRLTGFGYSGSVLLVKGDKVLLEKGYGLADRGKGISCGPDTLFEIGSLSKQFTATAIIKLRTQGKLKLSDALGSLLPDVPEDKKAITVEQLLTHTSGIRNAFDGWENIDRQTALNRILSRPLWFAPGTANQYSNGGYEVLAAVIDKVSGTSFKDYLRKELFEPAGLTSTGWVGSDLPKVPKNNVAKGYDWFRVAENLETQDGASWYGLGSGMVTSTVRDLWKWSKALRAGKIIPKSALAEMWTKHVTAEGNARDYGYGWFVTQTGMGVPLIRHGGDAWAFGSEFRYYPTEDLTLISLANIRHDLFPTQIRAGYAIPSLLWNQSVPQPPSFDRKQFSKVEGSIGEYHLPSGSNLRIKEVEGQLYIGAQGQDALDIIDPTDQDEAKLRAQRNDLAQRIIESNNRKDFSAMDGALYPQANRDYWFGGWKDEQAALGAGKGELLHVHSIGTYRHGNPEWRNTLVRLDYEKGVSYYLFQWSPDPYIESSNVTQLDVTGLMPLQPADQNRLVGWNVKENKGIQIELERAHGEVGAIRVKPLDGGEWVELKRSR